MRYRVGVDDADDDAALLEAWRSGDRERGSALFERYFATVFRFFASKLGDVTAQDLAQRTFLAAVESRDRIRDGQRMRAYLLGIARRQLLMFLRTRGRRGVDAELSDTCADELVPTPSAVIGRSQEEDLLLRALRRISLDQQMLIELYYWESCSTDELAELLAVPRGTIKSRLFRAREDIRTAIEQITTDAALRQSTSMDFERWVAAVREHLGPNRDGGE